MSRLAEILENHQNLDEFFSITKHYGVSAEYISSALIKQFEQDSDNGDGESEERISYSQELIDDLKQFRARF